ncbi:unnamed protein product [Vitrella brassicaformis CCMP3155]|uniref:Uncharacterized protein n=1 Tax=Vitrella brassicaformis (strain CCMP3155) TaxID=1169540 RepID=A0A0G4H6D2_VITBC|nr:unnamed protein product [Vitrella brassicaformis CCMP3155]|eukprot:CEM39393.1 unnamed protein product [Vitrella brassicaformis CCMP3155]
MPKILSDGPNTYPKTMTVVVGLSCACFAIVALLALLRRLCKTSQQLADNKDTRQPVERTETNNTTSNNNSSSGKKKKGRKMKKQPDTATQAIINQTGAEIEDDPGEWTVVSRGRHKKTHHGGDGKSPTAASSSTDGAAASACQQQEGTTKAGGAGPSALVQPIGQPAAVAAARRRKQPKGDNISRAAVVAAAPVVAAADPSLCPPPFPPPSFPPPSFPPASVPPPPAFPPPPVGESFSELEEVWNMFQKPETTPEMPNEGWEHESSAMKQNQYQSPFELATSMSEWPSLSPAADTSPISTTASVSITP